MLRSGTLLRLTDDLLLHASAVNKLRDILRTRGGQPFTVAEFKEWAGVSRKYAVPLLEFSDRQKLTRRNGELRTVIETGAAK